MMLWYDYVLAAQFSIGIALMMPKLIVGILDFYFLPRTYRTVMDGVVGPFGDIGTCIVALWLLWRLANQ